METHRIWDVHDEQTGMRAPGATVFRIPLPRRGTEVDEPDPFDETAGAAAGDGAAAASADAKPARWVLLLFLFLLLFFYLVRVCMCVFKDVCLF